MIIRLNKFKSTKFRHWKIPLLQKSNQLATKTAHFAPIECTQLSSKF